MQEQPGTGQHWRPPDRLEWSRERRLRHWARTTLPLLGAVLLYSWLAMVLLFGTPFGENLGRLARHVLIASSIAAAVAGLARWLRRRRAPEGPDTAWTRNSLPFILVAFVLAFVITAERQAAEQQRAAAREESPADPGALPTDPVGSAEPFRTPVGPDDEHLPSGVLRVGKKHVWVKEGDRWTLVR